MRILWLKTELLHPVDKGGKIRTYQMLKELRKGNHITYLTLDDGKAASDAAELASEYADKTICIPHATAAKFSAKFYFELVGNLMSKLPYALQKYRSGEMCEAIRSEAASGNHDVLVCDFLAPAVNLTDECPIPSVLFQHNVEAMIWQRHFENEPTGPKRAFLKSQWRRMRDFERESCRSFDMVAAVSSEDAETMRRDYGITNVYDVPTGVDTEYFSPGARVSKTGAKIVFTGSMDWLPNEDAIVWFVREILPIIRKSVPDVTLTVVGRDPSPRIRELQRTDASIAITGRVPDVRPFMNDAGAYIVPIRIGGGTRLKIYEALAMELPVVSTAVGAEGLPLDDGEHILIRDDPASFAEAVIGLLKDETTAKRIGESAAAKVRAEFGWSNAASKFAAICETAASGRGSEILAEAATVL